MKKKIKKEPKLKNSLNEKEWQILNKKFREEFYRNAHVYLGEYYERYKDMEVVVLVNDSNMNSSPK